MLTTPHDGPLLLKRTPDNEVTVTPPTLPHTTPQALTPSSVKCPPDRHPSSLLALRRSVVSLITSVMCSQPLGQTFNPNRPSVTAQSSRDNESAVKEFQAVVSDRHIRNVAVRKERSLGSISARYPLR